MSARTNAINAAKQVAIKTHGSNLTRQARVRTAVQFVECMYDHNLQIQDLGSVGVRHIKLFIEIRRAVGDIDRTLQNVMSHIRVLLREIGRNGLAGDRLITNEALGINNASRRGTNTRVSEAADRYILAAAAASDDYIGAAVRLQRQLGLRAQEAVRSGPSLLMWEQQLLRGEPIHVVAGTKGGRPRFTHAINRVAALEAVRFALNVLRGHRRPDLFPQPSQKQAVKRYENVWSTRLGPASLEGATSHSYRYAYAQDRMLQCLRDGMSKRDALAMVAMDLGHGDGRGRYIKSVYGQTIDLLELAAERQDRSRAEASMAPINGDRAHQSGGLDVVQCRQAPVDEARPASNGADANHLLRVFPIPKPELASRVQSAREAIKDSHALNPPNVDSANSGGLQLCDALPVILEIGRVAGHDESQAHPLIQSDESARFGIEGARDQDSTGVIEGDQPFVEQGIVPDSE